MPVLTLYDLPFVREFQDGAGGRGLLATVLEEMTRDTLITSPSSIRDLKLDHRTLATADGFRYTATAYSRICRILAPGLSKVVQNISGESRPTDSSPDLFSRQAACNIFNEIVTLRFAGLLSSYQMVTDVRRQQIVGFLGPKTHFLENASFIELAESLVLGSEDLEFAGGSLVGRRLFVRYLSRELLPTNVGEFRRGYAFCLDEAGDDAIRAYLLYRRVECGSDCLQPPGRSRERQRRTGARFADRLRQLLAGVLRRTPLDMSEHMAELSRRNLFDDPDMGYLRHEQKKWIQILQLSGVPAEIATGVVGSLFTGNAGFGNETLRVEKVLKLTEYDLFHALILEARSRSQRLRESLERSAFSVFLSD